MCRFFVVAMVVFVTGCEPATKGDLRPLVATAVYYSLMTPPAPKPPQGPVKCENCNGLGYLTDGTVRTLCPVCRGNKVTQGGVQCQTGTCRPAGR
jgi:hypothetical protein